MYSIKNKRAHSLVFTSGRFALLIAAIFALQACSDPKNLDDLQEFTRAVRAAEKPKVDPLPELKPIEAFQYSASSVVSPFLEENVIPEVKVDSASVEVEAVLPNQNRQRQALEYYPLDSLRMVGTLEQKNSIYAIIFAPDETVHRVSIGNYAGTQLGQVIEVTEAETVLEETVRIDNKRWEKRKVSIALTE